MGSLRTRAVLEEAREGVAGAVADGRLAGFVALAFAVGLRAFVRTRGVAGLRVLGAFALRLLLVR